MNVGITSNVCAVYAEIYKCADRGLETKDKCAKRRMQGQRETLVGMWFNKGNSAMLGNSNW